MEISAPTNCPSCGSTLELVNSQLFCRNSNDCPAQSTKKVQHFCKVLKIKGFGEKTVQKLELTGISELLTLTKEYAMSKGLGEKTAQNLVDQVQDRLEKKIYVADFIAAMSIPLVGSALARTLASTKMDDIPNSLTGSKASDNLRRWFKQEWYPKLADDWEQFLVTDTIKETTARENKGSVCITGKLNDFPNRTSAKAHLESLGWEVKSSVTKTVGFLICEDGSNSSSVKKANQYDIPITTIKDLEDN